MNRYILFFTAVLLIFAFSGASAFAGEDSAVEPDPPVFVSGIRYFNQNEKGRSNWCVAYSVAMLLSSVGITENPAKIAAGLKLEKRSDSYFSWKSTFSEEGSVEKYINDIHHLGVQKKIFVTLRESTVQWIKDNIRAGRPVMAIYGKWEGHSIVLVGYDEEHIYINDPSGAFFSEATHSFGQDMRPVKWLRDEGRKSPYEGAAVRWKALDRFIRERNLWGYLFIIDGTVPVKPAPTEEPPKTGPVLHSIYGPNKTDDFYHILFN